MRMEQEDVDAVKAYMDYIDREVEEMKITKMRLSAFIAAFLIEMQRRMSRGD